MNELRDFLELLRRRDKLHIVAIALLMGLSSVTEIVGIGSVVAFLGVIASPSSIQSNDYLLSAYQLSGLETTSSFLTFLGAAMILAVALSNAFQAFVAYAVLKFVWNHRQRLTTNLMRSYLFREYIWFLANNTTELGKSVLVEANEIASGVLKPILGLSNNLLRALLLSAFLFLIDPKIALIGMMCACLVFTVLNWATKSRLKRLGEVRLKSYEAMFRTATEMLSGIKEVKLFRAEEALLADFEQHTEGLGRAIVARGVIGSLPNNLVQVFALGGVCALGLYYVNSGVNDSQVLTKLGLFAVAGHRLMGAAQRSFSNYSSLHFVSAALRNIQSKLDGARSEYSNTQSAVSFQETIEFKNVSYSYPGRDETVIDNLNLVLPCHSRIAFVGTTGSGKTTIINLVLGLLKPSSGEILIDGKTLDSSTTCSWRQKVGYVPQDVFLLDDTLENNIAFAVPKGEIDGESVKRATSVAQLENFIESELKDGYQTLVGERGARLSGGQRQRLGLARALYPDPEVLVLDEATSALDGATEAKFIDDLENLAKKKTMLVVAHRLQTVKNCDTIYVLQNGKVVSSGSYEELQENCAIFAELSGAGD